MSYKLACDHCNSVIETVPAPGMFGVMAVTPLSAISVMLIEPSQEKDGEGSPPKPMLLCSWRCVGLHAQLRDGLQEVGGNG